MAQTHSAMLIILSSGLASHAWIVSFHLVACGLVNNAVLKLRLARRAQLFRTRTSAEEMILRSGKHDVSYRLSWQTSTLHGMISNAPRSLRQSRLEWLSQQQQIEFGSSAEDPGHHTPEFLSSKSFPPLTWHPLCAGHESVLLDTCCVRWRECLAHVRRFQKCIGESAMLPPGVAGPFKDKSFEKRNEPLSLRSQQLLCSWLHVRSIWTSVSSACACLPVG
eukprot:27416-Amphidinium_carterae.1